MRIFAYEYLLITNYHYFIYNYHPCKESAKAILLTQAVYLRYANQTFLDELTKLYLNLSHII